MGLFKRTSEKEKLEAKYLKLLKESHTLSTVNRTKSDEKLAEAELVLKKIDSLVD